MRYFLAIILPPVAVTISTRKWYLIIINIVLCLFYYIPGIIHALFIVSNYLEDRRDKDKKNDRTNWYDVNIKH